MEQNPTEILSTFVRALKIPITRQSVFADLRRHPFSKSLLAISDVLTYYRVANAAYRLKSDQLDKLPLPFIAFLQSGRFAVVHKLSSSSAVMSTLDHKRELFSRALFNNQFAGQVLLAEKNSRSGEIDYESKRWRQRFEAFRLPALLALSVVLVVACGLSFARFFDPIAMRIVIVTLIKTFGILVTIFLVLHTMHVDNPLLKKICNVSRHTNCEAVLSSSAAKITKNLSWAEVGLLYFSGSWLTLVFNSGNEKVLELLAVLNAVCLPYTFYSVYYQAKIAKRWCVLCVCVQGLLWLEFVALIKYLKAPMISPHFADVRNTTMCFVACVIIWLFLKLCLLDRQRVEFLKQQVAKLKYNRPLFQQRLALSAQEELLSEKSTLMLGDEKAKNVITVVSNPYCGPCLRTHLVLNEYLEHLTNVKVQIVFTTSEHDDDHRKKVAAALMTLKATDGDKKVKEPFMAWSKSSLSYHTWKKNYSLNDGDFSDDAEKMLCQQREWCERVGINATPTIFINGYKVPNEYQIEDIKYLIPVWGHG